MNHPYCINCGTDLTAIDQDPNGDLGCTCKRCVAEEAHDFDLEPNAVFDRFGERIK